MSICLIDTGILCEILEVPNLCGSSEMVLSDILSRAIGGVRFD